MLPKTLLVSLKELQKPERIGQTFISPAVAGQDFARSEGLLTFERGQRSSFLDVTLTPKTGSLNPFPKRFQVVLSNPTGGARVDDVYGISNITIVSDLDSLPVWGLIDQLHQPLDDTILHKILQNLNVKVATEVTEEQLTAVVHIIDKVNTSCLFLNDQWHQLEYNNTTKHIYIYIKQGRSHPQQ